MMRRAIATTAAALILLGGCSSDSGTDEPTDTATTSSAPAETTPEATPSETAAAPVDDGGVPWDDYVATLRGDLDAMAADQDCAGLQESFDTADANSAATMNRTGHTNADLMTYIDKLMQDAGCYG